MKLSSAFIFAFLSLLLTVGCTEMNPTVETDRDTTRGGGSMDDATYDGMTALGEKRLGDHDVNIYVNEWRTNGSPEPMLLVVVQNNKDERHNGHVVHAWLTDSLGNEVTPRASGEWRKAHLDYNCPCDLKSKSVPAGTYKLWVSVDEAKDSWDVTVK